MDPVPASVLIIESHPLMREALCAAIAEEPDLSVGMKAANGMEALQFLKCLSPDIILFAMDNPGTHELATLKSLLETLPEIPILAFITNEMDGQEQAALEAGAHAVLSKAATRAELIMAIRELRMKVSNETYTAQHEEANEEILTPGHSRNLPDKKSVF
jgi:DNA-binding NarL/FixJ family response regulator